MTAEFGFGGSNNGIVEAQAVVIDDWEKFYLYQIGSQYAFQSYLPPNSTCCYVSTEIGYGGSEYGVLRARAYSVGSWERYWIIGLGGFSAMGSAIQTPLGHTSTSPTSPGNVPVTYAGAVACPSWLLSQLHNAACKKLIPIAASG